MEILLIVNLIIQSIVFLVVFFFIYKKDEDDKDRTGIIMQSYSDMIKDTTEKYVEELGKVHVSHFEQLEKQSTKQLQILERQTKDYMVGMTKLAEAMQPAPQPIVGPDLLDKRQPVENTIEKEDIPDQSLADMPRFPLDGVNIKFEGEEEIFPFQPQ